MQGAATSNEEMKPTLVQPQNIEKCPRCESLNTKFCYYNNYSLSQPRYFCKSCRRYWTKGGTLRNVPIGGGCRKAKRPKPVPSSYSSSGAVQSSPETQNAPPSSEVETGGVFGNSCYLGGGYFPSSEAIHQSTLNQTASQNLMNQSAVDLGIYSLGLPEQIWAYRSFGGDDHNRTWTAINKNNTNSSSAGNNKKSSADCETNCCNLVQSQWSQHDHDHLPAYAHPP